MYSENKKYMSFFDEYEAEIAPRLRRIDTMLRHSNSFTPAEIARAIGISPDEAFTIIGDCVITARLNRDGFFSLLRRGSSKLCRMLNRELECGSPTDYDPRQIAYIYELDASEVERAFGKMSADVIPSRCLPALFRHISA